MAKAKKIKKKQMFSSLPDGRIETLNINVKIPFIPWKMAEYN